MPIICTQYVVQCDVYVLTFGWRGCLLEVLAGREGVGGVGMGVAKTVGVAGVGGATICVRKANDSLVHTPN